MVTASEPFRRVVMADRINARAELVSLRAEVERWKQNCRVLNKTGDELRAELTTATRTAEVWERQHKQAVDIIEAMDLERGELMLARDYARDEA